MTALNIIKSIVSKEKVSNKTLASIWSTSRQHVWNILNGYSNPTGEQVAALMEAYNYKAIKQ